MNKMELSRRKVIVWKKWQLITGSILERDHYNYQSKVYIPYDVTIKNTHSIILNKIKVHELKFKVIASNGQQICNLKTLIRYGCKKKIFLCLNEKDITLISSPLVVKFSINSDAICEIFYNIQNVIFDMAKTYPYTFKPLSLLKEFLKFQNIFVQEEFTLIQIISVILNYIENQDLFDENNKHIVITSPSLEIAIDRKAFHLLQLSEIICLQLDRTNNIRSPCLPICIATKKSNNKVFTGPLNFRFRIQPIFHKLLRTVDGSDQNKIVFTYKQIIAMVSKYILSQKNHIFDQRNIHVAIIINHALQPIFKIKAFHRSQIRYYIDRQILFTTLEHLVAWKIACLINYNDIKRLNIPDVLKSLLYDLLSRS